MDEADLTRIHDDIDACLQSAQSKRSLHSKLNVLSRAPGFPHRILEVTMPTLSTNKLATDVCTLRTLLSMCTFSATLRNQIGHAQRRRLALEAERLGTELDELRRNEGKRETDIAWETILSWEDKFPRGTADRLVYLLYTKHGDDGGVQRADYTPMKIVDSRAECDADESVNYLVRGEAASFVFNQYKTARRYGQKITGVPPEVLEEVGSTTRTWLFQTSHGEPITANALSVVVKRAFQRHTGETVTINTLRRAYADYTLRHASTPDQALKAAHAMDHSLTVHEYYAGRRSVSF